MSFPATTPIGAAVFVTERSAEFEMYVLTVELLFPGFGSLVVELTVSVWVSVSVAAVEGTLTIKVKAVVVVLAARFVPSVQVRVAVLQVHPVGPVSETTVVPVGRVSTSFGVTAALGPELVTVCVYVRLLPGAAVAGPELVTLRAALPVAAVTAMFTVAELFAEFVSFVVVATVTVSAMFVPEAVPVLTV
jgi:hypothetical protein